jgi:hypothetical protein
LWEALLIQMNEFELQLESDLRRLLDPVVARPVPARRTPAALKAADALCLLDLTPRLVAAQVEAFSRTR